MKKEIVLKEEINPQDTLKQQIEKIKTDITPIFEKLRKALFSIIIILFLFLIMCFGQLYLSGFRVYPDKIMIASVGILTFISIFYALIISSDGRKYLDMIEKVIKEKEGQLRLLAVEKIKKSKDSEEMQKEITKINKEINKIDALKTWIDVQYMLLFVVICLFLAIISNISNYDLINFFGYVLFSLGISYSVVIVIEWRLFQKIFK